MLLVVLYIHRKKRKTTDLVEWDKGLVPILSSELTLREILITYV